MRFAGTWSRYSNRAMPQLTIAAIYHLRSWRFFKCAYQAKVMNTFDPISNKVIFRATDIFLFPPNRDTTERASSTTDRFFGREPSAPLHEILQCSEMGIEYTPGRRRAG